ncbi:hypothetical protein [Puniceicoccus vermicola]|uniref:Uncharacterized protein n=1 Tax=Puniceicoccus vermicola TaxID=388746 RepID=A0A7X1E5W8_9BACT|nr:hypothetical protein [Puniceicoccus vermicola]MBC2603498.1 hypothetical protein [Puniceicoccus vermicola]
MLKFLKLTHLLKIRSTQNLPIMKTDPDSSTATGLSAENEFSKKMKSKPILALSHIIIAAIAFGAGFFSGKSEMPENIHFVDDGLFYEGNVLFDKNADPEKIYEIYRYITVQHLLVDGKIVGLPLEEIGEISATIPRNEDGVGIEKLKVIGPNLAIATTGEINGRHTKYELKKEDESWSIVSEDAAFLIH